MYTDREFRLRRTLAPKSGRSARFSLLATAWNIMGGFMGYVNFGTAGFFAVGAYSSVVLYNLVKAPLLLMIPFAGMVCGLLGLGMGYLTLRLLAGAFRFNNHDRRLHAQTTAVLPTRGTYPSLESLQYTATACRS